MVGIRTLFLFPQRQVLRTLVIRDPDLDKINTFLGCLGKRLGVGELIELALQGAVHFEQRYRVNDTGAIGSFSCPFAPLAIPISLDPLVRELNGFNMLRQRRPDDEPRQWMAGQVLQIPECIAAPANVDWLFRVVRIRNFGDIDAEVLAIVVQDVGHRVPFVDGSPVRTVILPRSGRAKLPGTASVSSSKLGRISPVLEV
jgi:hypothetical protein